MNEVAELVARLRLKDEMSGPLGKIRKSVAGFDGQMKGVGDRAYKAGQQVGTGIKRGAAIAAGALGLLATQVYAGLQSLAQLESATAQTNAVIKSTQGVAGQTAESIRALSEGFEDLNATMDDKVIQSGANVLLTFTNIRKEAFEPTLEAALDLSTAMGQDLQTSIVQVGKALNDPIRGLTSLQRIGVSFTKQQREQIKALSDSGDALGAQKIILAELNKEFGGSFAAAGKTTTGTIASIGDAVEDLQKTLATGLLPVVQKILPKIKAALGDPKVVATVERLGKSIAELFNDKNMAEGGKVLGSLFDTAKAAAPVVKDAAVATLGAVKAAVSLFTSLPKEVQQLAIGAFAINKITGGLVTNLAGGLIGSVLKQLVAGVVNVKGATVVVSGGAGAVGAAGAATGARGAIGKVASAAAKVFLIGAAVGVFSELKGILDDQTRANREQAAGLSGQTSGFVKVAGITEMQKALDGIKAEEVRLNNSWEGDGFAFRLNIDGVRDAVTEQKNALIAAIGTAERQSAAAAFRASERAEATENRTANVVTAKLAEVRAAAYQTAQAVRLQDLSVTVKGSPITVNVSTSVADQVKSRTTFRRAGNVYAF